MNNYDILMENRKKIVEKLIKNMENGDLIFKKGWDINLVKPVNPVSEVSYKGGNRINLMNVAIEKNYKDPRWLTFNQAKSKGWNVKKGEKGVMCEKWIFDKIVKEIDPKTNEKIEVRKPLEKPIPSYFIVFNAEQINGIPEYKRQALNENEKIKIVNDFIKSSECPIREVAQDQAFYSPTKDEIILPLRSAFKSEEAFLRTTLHEMGHSTGHPDRLNRNLANKFGSSEYAKEELVAELTSVFTQAKLGLKLEGEHFNNHTSYLKSWIKVLKEDPNELFKAASQAEKATERLYENYLVLKKEEQQKIYIQERENEKRNIQKEKQFFKELAITLYYCEKNLGIPEKSILKGEKAYEALKTIVNTDIKEQGKQYKTSLEFQYKNYNTGEMKLYLGNSEFSGKEKVSQALEHRLKLFPLNLIKDKENIAKIQKTTSEEITKSSTEMLEEITKIMRSFKRQEKLYNEKILENHKPIIDSETKTKEHWVIRFNGYLKEVDDYRGRIADKELIKELKELNKKLEQENKICDFYFEKLKANIGSSEVLDKIRINLGEKNSLSKLEYISKSLDDMNIAKNLWAKKLEQNKNLELGR